jgi:hypothetical protein
VVIVWIANNAQNHISLTRIELRYHCERALGHSPTRGVVHTFLEHYIDEFTEMSNLPQETTKREIPRKYPEIAVGNLKDDGPDASAESVFSLGAVGISKGGDQSPIKTIVSSTM